MSILRTLWAIAIYGIKTQKGLVELRLEDKQILCNPNEAREFAMSILNAADAAESDEFIVNWILTIFPERANQPGFFGHILSEFRNFREIKRREHEKKHE